MLSMHCQGVPSGERETVESLEPRRQKRSETRSVLICEIVLGGTWKSPGMNRA